MKTKLAVRGARLFDGEAFHEGPALVLIENGRIQAVDLTGALPPQEATLVDLGTATLLPGLVDTHTHLTWDPDGDPTQLATESNAVLVGRAHHHAQQALHAGVTTLRDLGDRGFATLQLRDQYRSGAPLGPELLVAGPAITPTNGHCWFLGGEADTRSQVVAAVAERASKGTDWVKVMATGGFSTANSNPFQPHYDLEQMSALVREAREHDLPVTAHAHAFSGIAIAVEAGVQGIEHGTFYTERGIVLDPATVEAMARKGIWAGVTIARPRDDRPPEQQEIVHQIVPRALELMRAGVPVVVCTDAGINAAKPHDVFPSDLVFVASRGFTNLEALTAATSRAAACCGVADRKGRIVPGYDADLVAVPANPLHELETILDVRAVFRSGHRVR